MIITYGRDTDTKPVDKANGPIAEYVQPVCHDTLPWLISF